MKIRPELSVAFMDVLVDKFFDYSIKLDDVVWCVQHKKEYERNLEIYNFLFNWIQEFDEELGD